MKKCIFVSMETEDNYKNGINGYILNHDKKKILSVILYDIDFDNNEIYVEISDENDIEGKLFIEEHDLFSLEDFEPLNNKEFKKFVHYKKKK